MTLSPVLLSCRSPSPVSPTPSCTKKGLWRLGAPGPRPSRLLLLTLSEDPVGAPGAECRLGYRRESACPRSWSGWVRPSSGGQKGLALVPPPPPPAPPQHCLSGTWQCTKGIWWTMRVSPVSLGGLSILESSNKGINSARYCLWSPVGHNTFHQESLTPCSSPRPRLSARAALSRASRRLQGSRGSPRRLSPPLPSAPRVGNARRPLQAWCRWSALGSPRAAPPRGALVRPAKPAGAPTSPAAALRTARVTRTALPEASGRSAAPPCA